MGVSMSEAGMQPPEGPPVCAALNFLPFGMPPPISSTISRRVVPIGISTRPVLLILPTRQKTLVPLLRSVPMPANQSAPLRMMRGILAQVSTLFRMVGTPNRPLTAGKGGRGRGSPRCPSMEVISAVSSPQTKAPEPRRSSISKAKPVPKISSPKKPYSRACLMATCRRWMAMGYSART